MSNHHDISSSTIPTSSISEFQTLFAGLLTPALVNDPIDSQFNLTSSPINLNNPPHQLNHQSEPLSQFNTHINSQTELPTPNHLHHHSMITNPASILGSSMINLQSELQVEETQASGPFMFPSFDPYLKVPNNEFHKSASSPLGFDPLYVNQIPQNNLQHPMIPSQSYPNPLAVHPTPSHLAPYPPVLTQVNQIDHSRSAAGHHDLFVPGLFSNSPSPSTSRAITPQNQYQSTQNHATPFPTSSMDPTYRPPDGSNPIHDRVVEARNHEGIYGISREVGGRTYREYRCQHCPRTFSRPSTLIQHGRVHTGEKRELKMGMSSTHSSLFRRVSLVQA